MCQVELSGISPTESSLFGMMGVHTHGDELASFPRIELGPMGAATLAEHILDVFEASVPVRSYTLCRSS